MCQVSLLVNNNKISISNNSNNNNIISNNSNNNRTNSNNSNSLVKVDAQVLSRM